MVPFRLLFRFSLPRNEIVAIVAGNDELTLAFVLMLVAGSAHLRIGDPEGRHI